MTQPDTDALKPASRPALVLWDWNGTLLDDVEYAIGVRNRVFPRFGLPTLNSLAAYHEQFTFPVSLYYYRAGVTERNFVEVANAWMDEYMRGYRDIPLFPDVLPALEALRAAGCAQAVLSASKLDSLKAQLAHAGILGYFTEVLGLSHIYATSKEDVGRQYLLESGFDPACCALLGDTLHDVEVAQAVGCRCVLVARGHQSRETLLASGVPVYATLAGAVEDLLGRKTAEDEE